MLSHHELGGSGIVADIHEARLDEFSNGKQVGKVLGAHGEALLGHQAGTDRAALGCVRADALFLPTSTGVSDQPFAAERHGDAI